MQLLFYKEYYSVEKIKIVGCTYMAACGLNVNFAGSTSTTAKNRGSNSTGMCLACVKLPEPFYLSTAFNET